MPRSWRFCRDGTPPPAPRRPGRSRYASPCTPPALRNLPPAPHRRRSQTSRIRPKKRWNVRNHATKHPLRPRTLKWFALPILRIRNTKGASSPRRNRSGTSTPRKRRRRDAEPPIGVRLRRMSPRRRMDAMLVRFPPRPSTLRATQRANLRANLRVRRTPEAIPGGPFLQILLPARRATGRNGFCRSPKRRPSEGRLPVTRSRRGCAVRREPPFSSRRSRTGASCPLRSRRPADSTASTPPHVSRCCDGPSRRRSRYGCASPSRSGSRM